MPKLIINEKGRDQEWIHECKESVLTIGRHDDNILALPSHGVSRQHAQILKEDGDFLLVDKKSANGTFLNGMRITPNERYMLRNNDIISIDTFDMKFYTTDELVKSSIDEEITDSDLLEVKLLKKVLKAFDKETVPSFEVLNGSSEGEKFYLTDDISEIEIGRDPDIDFSINEHVISRKHAKIVKRWGGIVILDLESKNGTFVNNRKITEEYLHDGDRIALGTIVLMYRNPQEINLSQLTEQVPPKNKPADVAPQEIPGMEHEEEAEKGEEAAEEYEEGLERAETERAEPKASYPVKPTATKIRFSPVEIGMIGLGALVFIFALITLVNLIFA